MIILHIISGLNTGGAERTLLRLCEYRGGASVGHVVLSLGFLGTIGPRLKAAGVPVFTLDMQPNLPMPVALFRLHRVIQDVAPNILQGWMYHGNLAATIAQRWMLRSAVLVWNVRQSLYNLAYEKRRTRLVIRANRVASGKPSVIIYNSALSRVQHEAFGFAKDSGCVIPNGFDLIHFRPNADARVAVRAELGIPENVRVIGHVARLHPMKNHPGFLRALAPILARYSNVHAVLIGRGVTSDHPALATGLRELPADRVHCLGERNDIERLMPGMDFVCSSSSHGEAFPNVLGEAMACGVPCVVTDVGDSARIIDDLRWVVPPRDPVALSEALEGMLRLSGEERIALGQVARQRIEANFSIGAVAGEYRRLYERLVEERGLDQK